MIITVRNKKFEIEFVSNYVHKLWRHYNTSMSEIQKEIASNQGMLEKVKSGELSEAEGVKIYNESKFVNNSGSMNFEIERLYDSKIKIIKEILDKNPPCEYDSEWWEKNTDPVDIETFIRACIAIDLNDMSTSKKK